MNRALFVGINAYPNARLNGCVNDIDDLAAFVLAKCGFAPPDLCFLRDAAATTDAMVQKLRWLVAGAAAGDRLLFHFSGHGAQMPTLDPLGEVDGLDEVICPVDFNWTDAHTIRDKQFAQIFGRVPAGVEFVWISDSCHSGDLTKAMPSPKLIKAGHRPKPKTYPLPPPAPVAEMIEKANAKGVALRRLAKTASTLCVALIPGCQSDETSADDVFNGRPSGALTHFLLAALNGSGGLAKPLTQLVPDVAAALAAVGYSQTPQLEGDAGIGARPFLTN